MLRRSIRKRKVPIRSGAPDVQPVPLTVSKRKASIHYGAPDIQPVPSSASKRKAPIPSGVPAIQPASSSQPLDFNLNVPGTSLDVTN